MPSVPYMYEIFIYRLEITHAFFVDVCLQWPYKLVADHVIRGCILKNVYRFLDDYDSSMEIWSRLWYTSHILKRYWWESVGDSRDLLTGHNTTEKCLFLPKLGILDAHSATLVCRSSIYIRSLATRYALCLPAKVHECKFRPLLCVLDALCCYVVGPSQRELNHVATRTHHV